jgi:putative membrane protein insertion efficiency factor
MTELMLAMLRAYKRWISPALPVACRYVPSCSEYAMEAVALRGPAVGLLLALWRLLRCNPLARGGYDPVPPGHAACQHGAHHV